MKPILIILLLFLAIPVHSEAAGAKEVMTPYKNQKVIFDFYFDEPEKIGPALYWLRSWMNPLMKSPYNEAPEFLNVVIMIHGTELVTLAKKNEKKYQTIVDRMRYYADFGFRFKVCGLAMKDFDYRVQDMQDFVEIVPSAMTEIVHWQQQGYGLIVPQIYSRKFTTDEIR